MKRLVMMNRRKSHIKFAILGHVDSGKTTLAGHLIYRCGVIDKRIFNRFEEEAIQMGKKSFEYAWIFDRMKRRRELDVNIDISSCQFETNKNCITLMDGPGNRDFIKCMLTTMSLADWGLLLIAAGLGEFEASISKHSSMCEQISLAYKMGIENLIIVVNKMDTTVPPYSEDRFDEIKTELLICLKKIGYQPENIIFIPISAWFGDNLIESSDNMLWFKRWAVDNGKCKTLLEALDSIVLTPPLIDKPLRLTVRAVRKTDNDETMLEGYVETGILKSGMTVWFAPINLSGQIRSIQMHYKTLEEALPGDNVLLTVDGINKQQFHRGFIGSDINNDPAAETSNFIAQLNILYHSHSITKGFKCVILCHMAQITCEFIELLEKIDQKTGKTIEKNPEFLKSDDTALVKILPLQQICVENYIDYPSLGYFIISDQGCILGVGFIKHIEKKNL